MDTYREALDADLAPGEAGPAQPSWSTPSLRRRLLVLVGGSMLPVLILAAAVVMQGYGRAEQAAQERVLQITRSTVAAVDRDLENRIAALQVLALSPALQTADFEAFRGEAERFLSRIPSGAGISVSERSTPAPKYLRLRPQRRRRQAHGDPRPRRRAVHLPTASETPLCSN